MWPFTRKKKPEAKRVEVRYPPHRLMTTGAVPLPATPSPTPVRDESDFLTSMLIANATDNAALGYLAGGSITGAIVGESIAESNHHSSGGSFDGGHGGDFGGGGSSSDWGSSSDSCSSSSDSSSSFDSGGSCDSGGGGGTD